MPSLTSAFHDTKSCDRDFFGQTSGHDRLIWSFHEFRLEATPAATARGAAAVCVCVNDRVDPACLEILARENVRLVALRCAGFSHVDVKKARKPGLTVGRVPAASPRGFFRASAAACGTTNGAG